jgi:hypothetical protein
MNRRQVLAGAAWATPTILIAKPSGAATLSSGPEQLNGPSAQEIPQAKTPAPLAFTGDNTEQDVLIAAGLIAAGWCMTRWQAGEQP